MATEAQIVLQDERGGRIWLKVPRNGQPEYLVPLLARAYGEHGADWDCGRVGPAAALLVWARFTAQSDGQGPVWYYARIQPHQGRLAPTVTWLYHIRLSNVYDAADPVAQNRCRWHVRVAYRPLLAPPRVRAFVTECAGDIATVAQHYAAPHGVDTPI